MNPGRRFTVFSTDGFSGLKNFKYMFSGFLCCLWSDQLEFMVVFMVFNLWVGPGFTFESHKFLIFQ